MPETTTRRKKRRKRSQAAGDNTALFVGLGVGAVVVAAAAAYLYFRRTDGSTETSEAMSTAAATRRVQAMTGFVPAVNDVTPEQQRELDAWQPPEEGVRLTARAEYFNSKRAAQREAAALAAAEAAATAGDD